MKRIVIRLVVMSLKSGHLAVAEFRSHRIKALVRAENGHEAYLAIIAEGVPDPQMFALLLDCVPGVAPASGGPIDLVQPSHTGWLYAPGDLAAMRGHVADLLGDDRKRAAFSAAARAWVAPRTWDAVCARLVQYYRSAIASNREQLAHHLADPLGELLGWEGPRERVRDLGLDRRPRQRSIAS